MKHIHCITCGSRKTRSELRLQTEVIFTVLQKQFFKLVEDAGHFCSRCYHMYTDFCEGDIKEMTTTLNKINPILLKRNRPPHTAKQLNDIRFKYQNTITSIEPVYITSNDLSTPIIDNKEEVQNDQSSFIGSCTASYCIIRSELLVQICTQANCLNCNCNQLQLANIHYKGVVSIITLFCNACETEMKIHSDYFNSNGAYELNKRFSVAGHLGCLSFPSLKRFCLAAGMPCIGKTYFNTIGVKEVYPTASFKTSAQLLQNRIHFFKKYFQKFKLRLCLYFHDRILEETNEIQVYQETKEKGEWMWSLQRFYSYQCEEVMMLIYSFMYPSIYITIAFDGSYPSKRNADYVRVIVRETKLTKQIMWRSYKLKQRTHESDSSKFVGPSNMLEGKALEQIFQQMTNITYCGMKLYIKAFCHDNDGKARGLIGQYFHSIPYSFHSTTGHLLKVEVIDPSSLSIDPNLQKHICIPLINPARVPFFLRNKYSIKIEDDIDYEKNLVPANVLFKQD